MGITISDEAYSDDWVGATEVAVSQNALHTKFVSVKEDIDAKVDNEPWGIERHNRWNGITDRAPSKDALHWRLEHQATWFQKLISNDEMEGNNWEGRKSHAPSMHAMYKILKDKNFPVISISNQNYSNNWEAITDQAPSKKAVYEKLKELDDKLRELDIKLEVLREDKSMAQQEETLATIKAGSKSTVKLCITGNISKGSEGV